MTAYQRYVAEVWFAAALVFLLGLVAGLGLACVLFLP